MTAPGLTGQAPRNTTNSSRTQWNSQASKHVLAAAINSSLVSSSLQAAGNSSAPGLSANGTAVQRYVSKSQKAPYKPTTREAAQRQVMILPPERSEVAKGSHRSGQQIAPATPAKADPREEKRRHQANQSERSGKSDVSSKPQTRAHHSSSKDSRGTERQALKAQVRRDLKSGLDLDAVDGDDPRAVREDARAAKALVRPPRDAAPFWSDGNVFGWEQNYCQDTSGFGCEYQPAGFDPSVASGSEQAIQCVAFSLAGNPNACGFQQSVSRELYDITGGFHVEYKMRVPLDGKPTDSFIVGGVFAQELVPAGIARTEIDLFEVWGSQNQWGKNNAIRFLADGTMVQNPLDIVGIDMTQVFTTTVDLTAKKANGLYDITFNYFQGSDVPKSTRTITDIRLDSGKLQLRINAWAVKSGLWNGNYAPGDCHFRMGPVKVVAGSNSSWAGDGSSSSNILGPVLGGVLGGVAILVIIAGVAYRAIRKRRDQIALRQAFPAAGQAAHEIELHPHDQEQVRQAARNYAAHRPATTESQA